jgi:competence protein ComGC
MSSNCRAHNQAGIALSEVLLIVFVISIIAVIIVPRFVTVSEDAKIEACRTNVANIDSLIQLYYVREGTWPVDTLADIGTNINYFPEATLPKCPLTDGAIYSYDTPTYRVTGHLRSSAAHP